MVTGVQLTSISILVHFLILCALVRLGVGLRRQGHASRSGTLLCGALERALQGVILPTEHVVGMLPSASSKRNDSKC